MLVVGRARCTRRGAGRLSSRHVTPDRPLCCEAPAFLLRDAPPCTRLFCWFIVAGCSVCSSWLSCARASSQDTAMPCVRARGRRVRACARVGHGQRRSAGLLGSADGRMRGEAPVRSTMTRGCPSAVNLSTSSCRDHARQLLST